MDAPSHFLYLTNKLSYFAAAVSYARQMLMKSVSGVNDYETFLLCHWHSGPNNPDCVFLVIHFSSQVRPEHTIGMSHSVGRFTMAILPTLLAPKQNKGRSRLTIFV
jgi:hypothetical protein